MVSSSNRAQEKAQEGRLAAGLAMLCCLVVAGCKPVPQPALPLGSPTATTAAFTAAFNETATGQASATATSTVAITATETPQPSLTPTRLACREAGGHFETGGLDTGLLRQQLEYRVYLPPCYGELPELSYPVLYLIHGQSYNDDQWERLGVGELAGELAASGELPPFLIVMPRDRIWLEPTDDRFGQAVVEVLLPWIDANYRTRPEREFRAAGGLSRGGAWALHLGLNYTEHFGAIGMHSGFVFHSDAPFIRSWLESTPPELMPRFYLDIGDNDRPDIAASATWFEGLLTSYNIPHEWHIFTGYHEESYWQAHVEQYLRWYAEGWRAEP